MDIFAVVSLVGTALGMCSRVPQILRVYERQSASDISGRALLMNIVANACFATYSLAHSQWPILANNTVVVTLDGTLLGLRYHYGHMKKSSSQSNLVSMGEES